MDDEGLIGWRGNCSISTSSSDRVDDSASFSVLSAVRRRRWLLVRGGETLLLLPSAGDADADNGLDNGDLDGVFDAILRQC